ncbi:MAG: hypothetical protein AAGA28_15945 [Pseudomonadota bacterium]
MIRTIVLILTFMVVLPVFAEEKEGGIIGTGVIGRITALDQFEVSGMRFDFAPDIELKGVRALDDLRMGMTLALSTGRDGEAWQIKSLQHMPVLSGPVTAPGEVMGVPVAGALPASGAVQVDGFWSESGIVASRITEFAEDAAQVSGIYDGHSQVGQVPVQGGDLSEFSPGQTLTVLGRFVDGTLVAETVMQGPFMDGSPDLVLLEGFFQPMPRSDTLSLHGIAVASATAEQDIDPDEPVRRCALHGRTDFLRSALTTSEEEMVNSFCVSATN